MKPTLELMTKPLENEPWWAELTAEEKAEQKRDDGVLIEALEGMRRNRMTVGEVLLRSQQRLEPHRCFLQYMERNFPFSQRTGYRMMEEWRSTKQHLPEPVIREAFRLGLDLVGTPKKPYGEFTEAVKELPPPEKPSPKQASAWLQNIVEIRRKHVPHQVKETKAIQKADSREAMRGSFIAVRRYMRRVLEEERGKWAETLCGMLLTAAGIGKAHRIAPVAIPDGWIVVAGRPKKAA